MDTTKHAGAIIWQNGMARRARVELFQLPTFSHDLRPKLAMRLNLQVPPSVAVTGQAAGLCLALCLNLHPAGVLPALADDGTSGAAVCPALSSALGNPHLSLIQPHAHAHPHRQLTPTLCCAAQVKYKFPPIDRKKVGRCEFSSSAMGQAPPTAEAHHRANPRCGRGTSLEGSPVFRAP